MFQKIFVLVALVGLSSAFASAAGVDRGIGPVTEVMKLDPTIDKKLAEKGKGIFTVKCSACHKIEERYVGPALKGVTKRRSPEWIMNMALNPAGMLESNDAAKELFGTYLVPMTFQNVTKDEVRAILEYFRANDEKK